MTSTKHVRLIGGLVFWLTVASGVLPRAAIAAPYQVRFENSCIAAVQAPFSRAVTLLHSFEYPETARMFGQILEQDPDCVMAYWGAAMSLWHPLWAPPGKGDLVTGARLLDRASQLHATPREHAYIDALRAYFSSDDPGTHAQRARAYEERMSVLHADYLDDLEAATFYALALLATQDPRDKSYAHSFRAAAVLNWVRAALPDHPGAMHYLIHSYDFPGLAYLALDVARVYAKAAPDSAHAQHMPSHIFTRLGLWELSLASNHDSMRSAAEYTERARLPGHYDEGLHSMDYMMYAMLQTARDEEALQLLGQLARIEKTEPENFKVAYTYAASPARYVLERRAWKEASELALFRPDFAWDDFAWARSIHHFARGIGAARSGQTKRARAELATIEGLRDSLPATTLPYWKEEVQVHADAVSSWILFAQGKRGEALQRAAMAADREDGVDKHPVTPGEVLPARELYADMLAEAGDHAEALAQYRRVLKGSPNRLNALIGAAAAASRAGDPALSAKYREIIQEQTRFGNRRRPGLAPLALLPGGVN